MQKLPVPAESHSGSSVQQRTSRQSKTQRDGICPYGTATLSPSVEHVHLHICIGSRTLNIRLLRRRPKAGSPSSQLENKARYAWVWLATLFGRLVSLPEAVSGKAANGHLGSCLAQQAATERSILLVDISRAPSSTLQGFLNARFASVDRKSSFISVICQIFT